MYRLVQSAPLRAASFSGGIRFLITQLLDPRHERRQKPMKATAYLDSPVSASRALSASREESAASAMPADGLRSVDRRSFERRRGLAASLVLLACLSQGRAEAQCSVNCNPISGGVSCTVALTQSPCAAFGLNRCTINYPPSQTMVMTTVLSSTNASCVPGATDDSVAMAFHSAGQGLPAQCDFRFPGWAMHSRNRLHCRLPSSSGLHRGRRHRRSACQAHGVLRGGGG